MTLHTSANDRIVCIFEVSGLDLADSCRTGLSESCCQNTYVQRYRSYRYRYIGATVDVHYAPKSIAPSCPGLQARKTAPPRLQAIHHRDPNTECGAITHQGSATRYCHRARVRDAPRRKARWSPRNDGRLHVVVHVLGGLDVERARLAVDRQRALRVPGRLQRLALLPNAQLSARARNRASGPWRGEEARRTVSATSWLNATVVSCVVRSAMDVTCASLFRRLSRAFRLRRRFRVSVGWPRGRVEGARTTRAASCRTLGRLDLRELWLTGDVRDVLTAAHQREDWRSARRVRQWRIGGGCGAHSHPTHMKLSGRAMLCQCVAVSAPTHKVFAGQSGRAYRG